MKRAAALFFALFTACAPPPREVSDAAVPAAPGSAEPSLEVGADGRAYLSWIEPAGDAEHALRFSVWDGTGWSAPRTVATGANWVVNWADFPAVTALGDGTVAAHWIEKLEGSREASRVMIAFSRDGGASWGAPFCPHDESATEHGFVSKVPLPDGRLAAIWLDGRETVGGHGGHDGGAMSLRTAVFDTDGRLVRAEPIDPRVCDCCQTSAALLDDGGLIVAYRDRSEGEIRDIAVSRFDGERWSEPANVHDDQWLMPGCPVNGPALAVDGDRVAVAWFTAAGAPPAPKVRAALSTDGGRSFGPAIEVDGDRPAGRVDVVFDALGAAVVTWIGSDDGAVRVLARRVHGSGRLGPVIPIANTTAERAAGFPRSAVVGSQILVAWTEAGTQPRVRSAVVR